MTFHIALNMAGAVSAGAYTGGVIDFLVEALDEWSAAKEQCRQKYGDDTSLWPIPAHDVMLEVMSGASAGGMCSSIGAVALQEQFDHIRAANPGPNVPRNRLYWSWVETIDIVPLLGTVDLPNGQGPVKSLLDSTPIADIAQTALAPNPAKAVKRAWIAPNMAVILTLSNMRGVPYSVDEADGGSFEERMAYHADFIQFSVASSGAQDTDGVYALNYSDSKNPNWKTLQTAAMATGAFPVMLASRVIERKRADYENRWWNVENAKPAWDDKVVPATFENPYADGGMTNNNPFEGARQYLVKAAGNVDHNPRDAGAANAAVISVAPFPGEDAFDPSYKAEDQTTIGNVIGGLIGVLVNQARFQGEDLVLTKDPNVYSRFAIAPSDDSAPGKPALLSGALGAFGGFVDRKFRDHDYQLGRRNCQKFLMDVFILPEDNVTIADGVAKKPDAAAALRTDFSLQKDGKNWYQVIPLVPSVATPIPAPNRPDFYTNSGRLEQVAQAAENRVKAVLHAFLNSPTSKHPWFSLAVSTFLTLGGGGRIKDEVLTKLKEALAAQTG